MPQTFLVSPGVNVTEYDLTQIIPSVATTDAALAGIFRWGPVGQVQLVDSEVDLGNQFGTPTNLNPETWFTGADYLGYGSRLHISRAADISGNTVATGNATTVMTANTGNLTSVNTANLVVGMVLFYSNNVNLVDDPGKNYIIATIDGPTSLTLTGPALLSNVGANLVFRDNITYSAVAQEIFQPTLQHEPWSGQTVLNEHDYLNKVGNFDPSITWVARYPGSKGNSLRIAQCDSANQFSSIMIINNANTFLNAVGTGMVATIGSPNLVFTWVSTSSSNGLAANTFSNNAWDALDVGDLLQVGNNSMGFQYSKIASISTVTNIGNTYSFTVVMDDDYGLAANLFISSTVTRYWEFFNEFGVAPGISTYQLNFGNNAAYDELHIVVVDDGGEFTKAPGTVLEVYKDLSRATDAKAIDGGTNYYKDVINAKSPYIWWAHDRSLAPSNTANFLTSSSALAPMSLSFYGGSDGLDESTISIASLLNAWDFFASPEDIDISLLLQGKARGLGVSSNTQLATYLIQNIAEERKDCVAFISPDKDLVVNNLYNEVNDMVAARNVMPSSSYGVLDSGYKYRYDRYNDLYRWTPLNGDLGGLCARTDQMRAPWWSPAGFTRGNINNVIKLALNPRQSSRDELYVAGINPVVTFPGLGTVLYGDKTMLDEESAFSRINVRRLFIVLEKAISTAAKFFLFEFNDDFTRAQFKSMVNPYLQDVKSRRGIYDFLVVCDATNNTPDVIDANQFIGDIYIKPARSINFIQLNFVAVRTGVQFSEVVGKF